MALSSINNFNGQFFRNNLVDTSSSPLRVVANGGFNKVIVDTKTFYYFTSTSGSSSIYFSKDTSANILVVGGGSSGQSGYSFNGGPGGISGTVGIGIYTFLKGRNYTIQIGAGGNTTNVSGRNDNVYNEGSATRVLLGGTIVFQAIGGTRNSSVVQPSYPNINFFRNIGTNNGGGTNNGMGGGAGSAATSTSPGLGKTWSENNITYGAGGYPGKNRLDNSGFYPNNTTSGYGGYDPYIPTYNYRSYSGGPGFPANSGNAGGGGGGNSSYVGDGGAGASGVFVISYITP